MNMGCSTSAPAVTDANKANDSTNCSNMAAKTSVGEEDSNKYPASEAFIIPLSDGAETKVYTADAEEAKDLLAATVKKQPPKRIQELIEQAAENEAATVNLQDLEEKLEKAEERRKEYLQQKITTIQKTTQMLTRSDSKELVEKEEETQVVDGKTENKNDNPVEHDESKK
ncbi:uncharacterized protein LOC129245012 [Anastrepha obliqua]|uniref:uncharacterized protein LOC129245012 n=1 Tax=Anastrepha obliqua TaxID=95512 RepID=UPI0024094110|nr:uncharacterized protein LOC129245012 [Anastrepha obliqua]